MTSREQRWLLHSQASINRVKTRADIETVCRLARTIWVEHYTPIIGRAQVEYMLEKYQSPRAVAEQMADGYEYYLAHLEKNPVAYSAIQPQADGKSVFLSKIYVRGAQRGHGLGKQLLQRAVKRCRETGASRLWLTVNKNNRDTIEWYASMGFENTGPIVTDIGSGFVMDDYRMEKVVS